MSASGARDSKGLGEGKDRDKEAGSEFPLLKATQTWFSHLDATSLEFRPQATQK
jgi:hypothetical protein